MSLIILKLGGGAELLKPEVQANFCRDVASHVSGNQIVIVNGANSRLTQVQREKGIEPKILTSEKGEKSRYTDTETLELLREVYGEVNRQLVASLKKFGVAAVGYFGSDEKLILAKQHGRQRVVAGSKIKMIDGDLTGKIEAVNIDFLNNLLNQGTIPVLTPPAITTDGQEVNVDGDKLAAKIAIGLKAEKLIFFSDTAGLLRDLDDPVSIIPEIKAAEADQYAEGRMKKKISSAARAVKSGIREVIFADGRREEPLTAALAGVGTRVV